ncbi:MAG: hypothetical protein ACRD22_18240 [Terriglobia bacterium]
MDFNASALLLILVQKARAQTMKQVEEMAQKANAIKYGDLDAAQLSVL